MEGEMSGEFLSEEPKVTIVDPGGLLEGFSPLYMVKGELEKNCEEAGAKKMTVEVDPEERRMTVADDLTYSNEERERILANLNSERPKSEKPDEKRVAPKGPGGLGIRLARDITERMHGGELVYEGAEEGGGIVAVVTFPQRPRQSL